MSKTTVTMFSKATDTPASNIAASKSFGHKKQETLFVDSFVGSSSRGISYVNSKTRNTNDLTGEILSTGIASDIAIEGTGMLIVSDTVTGEKVFTRRGDFRQDELGYWKNGGDQLLYAWELDTDGNLPQSASLMSSLKPVNFANTKGSPVATTIVSVSLNLNSAQEALRGPGVTAKMYRGGLNANTGKTNPSEILLPEYTTAKGGLTLGDEFTFKSDSGAQSKTLIYGGIAIANTPSGGSQIYGASTAGATFNFVGLNAVPDGAQLNIIVGGTTYTFNAQAGTPSATNKTFNSIQTLAAAIDKVSTLNARVDSKGTLYIAPQDPNAAVSFTGVFAGQLGLSNIPAQAAAPNTFRFNSLASLQKLVNDQSDIYSLKATVENGNIQITSLLSTDNFTITGKSLGKREFTSVTKGDGTEKGRATVRISSPGNNLQTGDLVRIAGLGGQTPDGIYAVGKADKNGFEIFVISNDPQANAGVGIGNGLPDLAGQPQVLNNLVAASWQKIPGQKFAAVGDASITASVVGAVGANTARVTITKAAHGLVADDVIYISGVGTRQQGPNDVNLPDGYYIVAGVANVNDFQIIPNAVALGNAFPAGGAFSYQKVGSAAAGFGAVGLTTFNSNVMVTTDGIGSRKVKLFTTGNNYQIDDYITLSLGVANVVVDGVTVTNGVRYKITDRTADYVIFDAIDSPAGATTGDGVTGMQTYTEVPTIQIDNVSRTFEYFGIDQNKPNDLYTKTYDPTDEGMSLSANASNKNFPSSLLFTAPLKLYDSQGQEVDLLLNCAKLDTNKWAVEITAPSANSNIVGLRRDGQIAKGVIFFDENGKFTGTDGGLDVITFTNNGAAASTVTIDWENQFGEVKSGSVTQFANSNNIQPPQQNGRASGNLTGTTVDAAGFIIGIFDNGEKKKLWQIPLGTFANVNGLAADTGGTFKVTRESGDVLLKAAGVGGSGNTLGGALEASNADTTEELLIVQDLSNTIRANARVAGTEFKNINTILSELQ